VKRPLEQPECPRCAKPIADTGYVCHDCRRSLRAGLRWLAAMVERGELEATIGRQTATGGSPSAPKAIEQRRFEGPWCAEGWFECGHTSCRAIWRSWAHRNLVPAAANEDAGLLNLDALEAQYVLEHTARAWADFVHEQRGTIIPVARPRIVEPEVLEVIPRPPGPREWCDFGDLPADSCACGNPNATHPRRLPR
jgi:hypothetical protein